MGEIEAARARQIRERLIEIGDELKAIQAELGGDGQADSPEQRRAAFRVVGGSASVASA